jgi:hypothetical protein
VGLYAIFLFLPFLTIGQTDTGLQIVFSRRVYKERGPSFQQIWSWNSVSGVLRALTQSSRDHLGPKCENGKIIFRSVGRYEGSPQVWSFDPANGEERVINSQYEPSRSTLNKPIKGCDQYIQAGKLEACATNDEDLSLSRGGKQIGRWNIETNSCPIDDRGTIGKCDTPIQFLEFSPDTRWLLAGELGLETSSTAPQFDYYLIDISAIKLSKVASADQDILWLPRKDELLYVTPRDLAQLAGTRHPHSVWVQQLVLFDPSKGNSTAITSGVTNNFDPSLCSR